MSIEHIVIENGDALITRVSGQLTGEEMTEHMFWLIDNFGKQLNPGYRQLFDTTDMIDLSVNKSDINRISQIIQTYGADRGKIKTGIVTTHPRGRQMAFTYQALSRVTDVDVKIYDTVEEAIGWLRIDPGELPAGAFA